MNGNDSLAMGAGVQIDGNRSMGINLASISVPTIVRNNVWGIFGFDGIGINTENPKASLDINGTLYIQQNTTLNGTIIGISKNLTATTGGGALNGNVSIQGTQLSGIITIRTGAGADVASFIPIAHFKYTEP